MLSVWHSLRASACIAQMDPAPRTPANPDTRASLGDCSKFSNCTPESFEALSCSCLSSSQPASTMKNKGHQMQKKTTRGQSHENQTAPLLPIGCGAGAHGPPRGGAGRVRARSRRVEVGDSPQTAVGSGRLIVASRGATQGGNLQSDLVFGVPGIAEVHFARGVYSGMTIPICRQHVNQGTLGSFSWCFVH